MTAVFAVGKTAAVEVWSETRIGLKGESSHGAWGFSKSTVGWPAAIDPRTNERDRSEMYFIGLVFK